ncbi:MAG: phosphatidate cytidylyltransferase [Saprospiraceae bacterium]|nr:phosphatidate cytidylyltransferase [Saprospiraceae bacterium]
MLQRITTAIAFALIMLIGIFAGKWPFIALFGLVLFLCLWEYYTMVAPKDIWKDRWRRYSGITWGLIPFVWGLAMAHGMMFSSKILPVGILIYATTLLGWFFIPELFVKRSQRFSQAALGITGLIYIALPFGCLPLLSFNDGAYQPMQVFGLLLLVWANDSGAYLTGVRWGKHLLLPEISPKKTWEGWAGGTFLTLLTGYFLTFWIPAWTTQDGLIIALLVALWGPVGDLVESMLKREFEVKDSGKILPGHGGLLDRFDAFLFALPPVALYWFAIR